MGSSLRCCGSRVLAIVAALIFGGLSVNAQTPVFPQTQTYSLTQLNGIFVGPPAITDLNHDKKPDLVVEGSAALYVILDITNPASTLQTNPFSCSGDEATAPVIADVNHDGNPDVVFTCTNYVVVMMGNGDGTFQTPAYYAANSLESAVVADLNGDGYPDLIVATTSTSASQISVFLNKGAAAPGMFGTAVNYPAGASGYVYGTLGTGDFNGDGKQDVVAYSVQGTEYAVLLGNGDGTLQAPKVAATQTTPTFATGDFNGDGITDLVFVNSNGAQVLFGTANGTFTTGPALPVAGNYITTSALTSSSALDIVTSQPTTVVYHGDGKGNFNQTGDYSAIGVPYAFDVNNTGKQDLLLASADPAAVYELAGNGDGTFTGVPATPIQTDVVANVAAVADVNGDGVADILTLTPFNNPQAIATWIGRGDGTFVALTPTTPSPGNVLVTGDFNGDGKTDVVALTAGVGLGHGSTTEQDAELYFHAGNGNGTFQPAGTGVDLNVIGAYSGVTGDFNGDSKLDLVVAYDNGYAASGSIPTGPGLVFVPGNGDGTFGTPVNFAQVAVQNILVGDLNKDGKPDLITDGTVFLGNGDGTFRQIPLNAATGSVLQALADVNGDGYADLLASSTNSGQSSANVYLGNGDGTFQTTPSFTYTPPSGYYVQSAAIGDVNGDGHPDLVLYYSSPSAGPSTVAVAYGDGTGGFTNDTNTYFAGYISNPGDLLTQLTLTRINNAPAASGDNKLDALVAGGLSITSLLNTNNPAPTAPELFAASLSLQASLNTANENQTVTLTATVTGLNPTGTVTFTANGTSLGSATVTNGVATLATEFAEAGTYPITASYARDANNSAAQSNGVSITVSAPNFTITANPASASLTPGQSATFTLSVTPSGGYAGTVKFSCGSLPSEVTCTFNPSSVTPVNGASATTTLSISTTAAVASAMPVQSNRSPWTPGVLTLAGLLGLAWSKRARTRIGIRLSRAGFMMLLAAGLLMAGGCGGNGSNSTVSQNPGTPAGSYSIVVAAADSGSGPTHNMTLNVTVQ